MQRVVARPARQKPSSLDVPCHLARCRYRRSNQAIGPQTYQNLIGCDLRQAGMPALGRAFA
jgi:hypothetical protein